MALAPKADDIVITGVAALTPIGFGYEAMKRGLRRGEPRLGRVTLFGDDPAAAEMVGGQLADFVPSQILGNKGLRNKDRNTMIALSAVQLDLAASLESIGDPAQIGLTIGTTFGSLTSQVSFTADFIKGGMRALNAMEFPNVVINTPPSQCNIWFDLAASSATISNGFTAGLDAMVFSAEQLRAGRARYLVAGGSEELCLLTAVGLRRMGLTSTQGVLRPFDERRDGTLLGEGAALVLMERRADAEQRGARVLAQVLGCGSTFDGSVDFRFNPTGDGIGRAMATALAQAGLSPADVDFVSASANGSVDGDRGEAEAIRRVFGDRAATLPVVAYKSYWGECYGAGGAMQVAAALADLEDGVVSATCGFASGEAGINVTKQAQAGASPTTVMINSMGYTGHNTSVILRSERS